MDYLQYFFKTGLLYGVVHPPCFKPYYKWITFNTLLLVLLPLLVLCFKPYYKWITFNTDINLAVGPVRIFISFKPYYKWITFNTLTKGMNVVFMLERSLFYMVAKFEHFSVIHGFLTFYIKFLLQIFYFFLK